MDKSKFNKVFNKRILNILLLILPFLLMDLFIRITGRSVRYNQAAMHFPNIVFTIIWISLVAGIAFFLKKKAARIVYGLFFAVFTIMFTTHVVYFKLTGYFFRFNLLLSAEEGKAYVAEAVKGAGILNYLFILLVLVTGVTALICMPDRENNNFRMLGLWIAAFVIIHTVNPLFLGKDSNELKWDTWRRPRSVYENFSDSNKCMKICGLFEYTVRDFYLTFIKPAEKDNPEELGFLEEIYKTSTPHVKNEYTGIFKDKNVVFIQLEGIDDWLLTEQDTPTLYSMLDNSFVFTDHYSYYNGGGSTFNSELAVNTGLLTPISYVKNAYTFNTNNFIYSLPNTFKKLGYGVHAFHMNSAEYYSRGLNYKNWGYEAYHGLQDDYKYSDKRYELDRELLTGYGDYFDTNDKFMYYMITFTPHTPFVNNKGVGQYLAKLNGVDNTEMSEEEVARMFAAETDLFMKNLLDRLKDTGHYEDTVIVAFADHYLYTLNDKSALEKYKNTDNNLINHTPFFIWSADGVRVESNKINSQLDILPTVLNMFGIEYNDEWYIGHDIFDEKYKGYAFFADYSWYYDGKYFEGDSEVPSEYEEVHKEIINRIKQNDYILKYDYFERINKDGAK